MLWFQHSPEHVTEAKQITMYSGWWEVVQYILNSMGLEFKLDGLGVEPWVCPLLSI